VAIRLKEAVQEVENLKGHAESKEGQGSGKEGKNTDSV